MIERSVLGAGPGTFIVTILMHYMTPPFENTITPWLVKAGHIVLYTRVIEPATDGSGGSQYTVSVVDIPVTDYEQDKCLQHYPALDNYIFTSQSYLLEARAIKQG